MYLFHFCFTVCFFFIWSDVGFLQQLFVFVHLKQDSADLNVMVAGNMNKDCRVGEPGDGMGISFVRMGWKPVRKARGMRRGYD